MLKHKYVRQIHILNTLGMFLGNVHYSISVGSNLFLSNIAEEISLSYVKIWFSLPTAIVILKKHCLWKWN